MCAGSASSAFRGLGFRLSIQKTGFATDIIRVNIGVADTVPVTVLLKRLP